MKYWSTSGRRTWKIHQKLTSRKLAKALRLVPLKKFILNEQKASEHWSWNFQNTLPSESQFPTHSPLPCLKLEALGICERTGPPTKGPKKNEYRPEAALPGEFCGTPALRCGFLGTASNRPGLALLALHILSLLLRGRYPNASHAISSLSRVVWQTVYWQPNSFFPSFS